MGGVRGVPVSLAQGEDAGDLGAWVGAAVPSVLGG
jgi:hypothetical protein